MKAIAFNSSPNMDLGNTALLLDPFLAGMTEAGSDVELFHTKTLKVKPCRGDTSCTTRHPGRCSQKDDMNMLLPKIFEADVMVIASPLYFGGLSGPMKNLIDRMLPIGRASYEMRSGHQRLALASGFKRKKVALVATCGLWEVDNFDFMVHYMEELCAIMDSVFAGALLRPHANFLSALAEEGAVDDIFDSAKEAGRQLVLEGEMSTETLRNVSRELMSGDQYRDETNQLLQQLQEA